MKQSLWESKLYTEAAQAYEWRRTSDDTMGVPLLVLFADYGSGMQYAAEFIRFIDGKIEVSGTQIRGQSRGGDTLYFGTERQYYNGRAALNTALAKAGLPEVDANDYAYVMDDNYLHLREPSSISGYHDFRFLRDDLDDIAIKAKSADDFIRAVQDLIYQYKRKNRWAIYDRRTPLSDQAVKDLKDLYDDIQSWKVDNDNFERDQH